MQSHYPRWILATSLLFVAACIFVALGMRLAMSPYIFTSVHDVPRADVALILGASVVNGHRRGIERYTMPMCIRVRWKKCAWCFQNTTHLQVGVFLSPIRSVISERQKSMKRG